MMYPASFFGQHFLHLLKYWRPIFNRGAAEFLMEPTESPLLRHLANACHIGVKLGEHSTGRDQVGEDCRIHAAFLDDRRIVESDAFILKFCDSPPERTMIGKLENT